MLKLKEGEKRTVTINQIYFTAIKLYSESTGYTMGSIVETAIEQFFPNIDFEELSRQTKIDRENQIVYNGHNQT